MSILTLIKEYINYNENTFTGLQFIHFTIFDQTFCFKKFYEPQRDFKDVSLPHITVYGRIILHNFKVDLVDNLLTV